MCAGVGGSDAFLFPKQRVAGSTLVTDAVHSDQRSMSVTTVQSFVGGVACMVNGRGFPCSRDGPCRITRRLEKSSKMSATYFAKCAYFILPSQAIGFIRSDDSASRKRDRPALLNREVRGFSPRGQEPRKTPKTQEAESELNRSQGVHGCNSLPSRSQQDC
jgi:hypothetical protein